MSVGNKADYPRTAGGEALLEWDLHEHMRESFWLGEYDVAATTVIRHAICWASNPNPRNPDSACMLLGGHDKVLPGHHFAPVGHILKLCGLQVSTTGWSVDFVTSADNKTDNESERA